NRLNNGCFSLSSSKPASLASLLFTRLIGAPVSKINLYGPLPLTFTSTATCPDFSNSKGTTAVFAGLSFFSSFFCLLSSAPTPAASTRADVNATMAIRYISDALAGLDGQFLGLVAALDRQLHLRLARRLRRRQDHVGDRLDNLAVHL